MSVTVPYGCEAKIALPNGDTFIKTHGEYLFENDLYLEIGKHENECADILRKGFKDKGYKMYIESPSNQIFPIVDQQTLEKINKNYITTYMFKIDDQHTCIRLVTSWATSKEICEQFIEEL